MRKRLVYIASGFENRERVRQFAARLPPGWAWAYDWTGHTFDDDPQGVAASDFRGVSNADAVVVLLPGGPGTHTELGVALAQQIPTSVVGDVRAVDPRWPLCPFYMLAIRFLEEEQALAWLAGAKW